MESEYGQAYESLYRSHWWWRSREFILLDVIRSLAGQTPIDILDVGCGNGLFFAELGKFGRVRGIEVDDSLIPSDSPYRAAIFSKPLGDPLYQGMQFDLVTALDVIEHLEDDRAAVRAMLAMLRPGGKLLITVPAFMLLWDKHDEINRHYRRYRKIDLRSLVPGDGRLLSLKYLFHLLFFPKLLVKLANACFPRPIRQHAASFPGLNTLMKTLLIIEYRLAGRLPIPFGTSLLAVIEKA
jgi:SAM-dependent methyltransferase